MINLLPDDAKRQIRAGRTNVVLVRYIVFLLFAVVFLVVISAAVYLLLMNNKATAEQANKIASSKDSSYLSVQAQANSLRDSLTTAKSILDSEIVYSKVITGIAAALPSGVVIDSLTLDSTKFGTPIELTLHARSTQDALKSRTTFQKSSLLSNFKLESLSSDGSNSAYPVTANVTVTINRGVQ